MNVVIAGGGTGGHLFPGIAIAETLSTEFNANILFVGTERGIEFREVPKAGFALETIEVAGLKRVGGVQFVKSLFSVPKAFLQSLAIIRQFKPDAVIGVGGYASGPFVLVASLLGIPTAICEQNSVPGFTNKVLAKFVRRIFCAFQRAERYFPKQKCVISGNPVRQAFFSDTVIEREEGLIFTFGGSQGAQILNDVVPSALGILQSRGYQLSAVHQTGKSGVESVQKAYDDVSVRADVLSFIENMAEMYQRADLIICRAGATSCAEITALGVPSILIPFPYAADDHQTHNAMDLADSGAAVILRQNELTAESLAGIIERLLANKSERDEIAANAKAKGHPDAGYFIAQSALTGFTETKQVMTEQTRLVSP